MFTKENLSRLDAKKIKFIVAAKLKTMKKNFKEQILEDIAKALKGEQRYGNECFYRFAHQTRG